MTSSHPGNADAIWANVAAVYNAYASPFTPSSEDIQIVRESIICWKAEHRRSRVRVVLMGVTPLAQLAFEPGVSILAVDYSAPMIRTLWPGNTLPHAGAVCGNWFQLPVLPSAVDVVLADGVVNTFSYPAALTDWMRVVADALTENGIAIVRCFVSPDTREDPAGVLDKMYAGRFETFSHFEFELLIALQTNSRNGVVLRDAARFWLERSRGARLAPSPRFEAQARETIERWRDSDYVCVFPRFRELREILGDCFQERRLALPTYYLGERCPTLVLAPKKRIIDVR